MTLKSLIERGYFSEEMPPPFSTALFASKLQKVKSIIASLPTLELRKLAETNAVRFSIPKVGIHRRINSVPNPFHQLKLSESICLNWKQIKIHYRKSNLTASIPEIVSGSKRSIVQFEKYEKFKEMCIKSSYDTFFELRLDIAKYFPSIYTHSIAWAIHTKAISKINRRNNSLLGNVLDEGVRLGQSGQTIGLPIGTDSSRIIAEIIGCHIDSELVTRLKKENIEIKGYRFVDDCHFFFYTKADSEKGLKHLQTILAELSLNINEEKTCINHAPFSFDNDWNNAVTAFKFRRSIDYQRYDLRNYFSLLVNLSKKYPNDSVIKYGIKRLMRIKVHRKNWDLYESLCLSLSIAEGAILPDILTILLQNKRYCSKAKIESTIFSLLDQHIYKGNHFEVAWALWIAKSFRMKVPKIHAQAILDSRDIISIIILLDLRNEGLVASRLKMSNIKLEFNQFGLTNEHWLLVYEATHKGWITSSVFSNIKFFESLSNAGISFYDNSRQIEIGTSNVLTAKSANVANSRVEDTQVITAY